MGQSNMSGGVGLATGDTKPIPSVLKMRWVREGEVSPSGHPVPIRYTRDVPIRRRVSGLACHSLRHTWLTSLV